MWTRTSRRGVCVGLPIALLALVVIGSPLLADELDDAFKAWTAKQGRFRSLRFEWHSHCVWMPVNTRGPDGKPSVLPPIGPEKQVGYTRRHTLLIDGDKMIYSEDGGHLASAEGEVVARREVSTFDGKIAKSLDIGDKNASIVPRGVIYKEPFNHARVANDVKPIIWAFRPLDLHAGGRFRGWLSLHRRSETLGSQECVVMKETRRQSTSADREVLCYACPALGYSLLKTVITSPKSGQVVKTVEITYEEDTSHNTFVPVAWTTECFNGNGGLLNSVSSVVDRYELNPKIEESEFMLEFPPGTMVVDMRSGKISLVRPDRRFREVLPSEKDAGYEKWVATDTGGATPFSASPTLRWVYLGVNVLVFVCALIWLRRCSR